MLFSDMTHKGNLIAMNSPEYAILFQDIPFPSHMDPKTVSFINELLTVDPSNRLGFGADGFANIKAHPYFEDIDWDNLRLKLITPPYIPDRMEVSLKDKYLDFQTALSSMEKAHWLTEHANPDENKYFAAWDFTSATTLKVEFGIANEMEQYDKKSKARQLLGDNRKQGSVSGSAGSQYNMKV